MTIKKTINMGTEQSFCNCAYVTDDGRPSGEKGTTVWYGGDITLGSNQQHIVSFTDTCPDCYDGGTHFCIATYELATTANSGLMSGVIHTYLNDYHASSTTHSYIAGHNVTEAFDLVPVNNTSSYIKGGVNKITFLNKSTVPVQLKNFRIVRAYGMKNLTSQNDCDPEQIKTLTGIDGSRQDYPCNYANCGDRISYVHWGANYEAVPISPGESLKWTFTNPISSADNYVAPFACFFNFNNVSRSWPDISADTEYRIKLNGTTVATYYHGGFLGAASQFPTIDLAQFSNYKDAPGQTNTVELENVASNTATLTISNDPSLGGVDIYRFYKVKNICQDDFSNPEITNNLWHQNSLQVGGTVQVLNNQLQVSVPGSGYKQAGKVTRYAYDANAFYPGSDRQGFETEIDMVDLGSLRFLEFTISNTRTTTTDPYTLNNFYAYRKDRTDTTIKVDRRINGGVVSGFWKWWNSATGKMKIKVSAGSIAFYENNILRHAEPFMLPSNKCYIYAYTNSDLAGTGKFDNFSIKPAEGVIQENFEAGNYNNWALIENKVYIYM